MSPPASERAEPIAPHVHVTHTLRPSNGARTAQRAVPTTALNRYSVAAGFQRAAWNPLAFGAAPVRVENKILAPGSWVGCSMKNRRLTRAVVKSAMQRDHQ